MPIPTPTAPGANHAATGTPRWVWALVMTLIAVVVAGVAGVLTHAGGVSTPNAILAGGAAFGGTVLVLLGLAHYVGGGRE
jgi:hypothetical protein